MIIKTDDEELNLFIKNMRGDSEEFAIAINEIISSIRELALVWQGDDAKTFIENITNYLERMQVIPEALNTLSDVVEKINNGYLENDESFSKALEGVASKYEQ